MPRSNQSDRRRRELIPIVADTFSKLGYRRTTTAALAENCGVRENILYRLWSDKRAMFIAAIEYVYELSREKWAELLRTAGDGQSVAERLLDYEARRHGEFGLYRIVFAGLSETDDAAIRAALRDMYRRFHRFIRDQITAHRKPGVGPALPSAELSSWAIIGLGTVANIGRELQLLPDRRRRQFIAETGRVLLDGGQ